MALFSPFDIITRRVRTLLWPEPGKDRGFSPADLALSKAALANKSIYAPTGLKPEDFDALLVPPGVKQDLVAFVEGYAASRALQPLGYAAKTGPFLLISGGPGVGKSYVIHVLASLLRGRGLLRRNNLIEVDRAHLVAGYIGQTKFKTREQCQHALDGVLLVDQPNTLTGSNDFGGEALQELLAFATQHRDRILIVLAMAPWELKRALKNRPDLDQHIGAVIDCPTPDARQLCDLLRLFAYDRRVTLSDGFEDVVLPWIEACKSRNFWANVREMRSLLDRSILIRYERPDTTNSLDLLEVQDFIEALAQDAATRVSS